MKIMKFGGTSVKDASRIRSVLDILAKEDLDSGLVVVCSALKGVTDDLIKAAEAAANGDFVWQGIAHAVKARHQTTLFELLPQGGEILWTKLLEDFKEIEDILHGISLIRECSLRSLDLISGFGERLSNQLISAYAVSIGYQANYVDARPLVLTDDNFGNAAVQFNETYSRIGAHFKHLWSPSSTGRIAFVTGFIGSTIEGTSTTLGRNGSDYTASIFGAALGVSDIEIWTDVDGVLTCDPRLVPEAFVVSDLSVEEAMEMSYFGAEVIHPATMIPAVEKSIPVWIKNTMNPQVRGTRIAANVPPSPHAITGLAVIKNVALINVVGGGMVGAKGTAMKIFASLVKTNTNVIMISQASSEHSVSIIVREAEAFKAVEELRSTFARELANHSVQDVDLVLNLDVLSVIGANMRGRPGVAGKLFTALGAEQINILAIAQGSGEMNISCVIETKDQVQALQSIHRAFFPEAK
jgi:bifunctional aspartokinase / homoserine dehydrogenase 1